MKLLPMLSGSLKYFLSSLGQSRVFGMFLPAPRSPLHLTPGNAESEVEHN